jgi:hypothetical protein
MLLVLRPQKLHAKVRHRYSFQTRLPDPESVKIIEYRYQARNRTSGLSLQVTAYDPLPEPPRKSSQAVRIEQ